MTLNILNLIKSGDHKEYLLKLIAKQETGKNLKHYTDIEDIVELLRRKRG